MPGAIEYVYVGAGSDSADGAAAKFNQYGMRRHTAMNGDNIVETLIRAAQGLKDTGSAAAILEIIMRLGALRPPRDARG